MDNGVYRGLSASAALTAVSSHTGAPMLDAPIRVEGSGVGGMTISMSDRQAAPNPFNPRTTVRFALAPAGHAEVTIYDASGRRVRQLVEGALGAGPHAMSWEGDDDRGRTLASGVYFLRATSGGSTAMQRLVLLK